MPASPEAYYQQIGRAGRDGAPAKTLLLYGGEDIARARYWLELSNAPATEKTVMQYRLESMISLSESIGCRTHALLACFDETFEAPCGHCDNCCSPSKTFDGTQAAQKVLSAIYRTGQRFGIAHLTSVIRGKVTESVERHAHQHLPIFGIGKDQADTWWRSVIRQLIARGAIKLVGERGSLGLNLDVARPILRGETTLRLRSDAETTAILKKHVKENPLACEADRRRYAALSEWRRNEARAQALPPYVIFHDSTLLDIAQSRPMDIKALSLIRGVGASKLERYGDSVLGILKTHA